MSYVLCNCIVFTMVYIYIYMFVYVYVTILVMWYCHNYIYLSRFTWYNIQIFTCTSWCIYNILIIFNYGDGIVMVLPCIYTNFYYMPFIFNNTFHILLRFFNPSLQSMDTLWKKYLEYRFLMLSYKNIYLWYTKYVLIGTPLFWGGNNPSYLKHLQ